MATLWSQRGPYQFVQIPRLCPRCRAPLVLTGTAGALEGPRLAGRLGVACHCLRCNTKYRAQGPWSLAGLRRVFRGVWVVGLGVGAWAMSGWLARHPSWYAGVGMAGMLGFSLTRGMAWWTWWAAAELTAVTTWTTDTSFGDAS